MFWIVGFYTSRVVLPHRIEESTLHLHHGIFAEGSVPHSQIQRVQQINCKAPEWGDGLQGSEDRAYLTIGGNTNVKLKLHSPYPLRGFFRLTKPVSTVHLAVDEPKAFVQSLEQRLHSATSEEELATKV